MNKIYLLIIIFIATSYGITCGMDKAEEIRLPLQAPYPIINPQAITLIYFACGNQEYRQILQSRVSSYTEGNLDFFKQQLNPCTLVISPNSIGIFNQTSKRLAYFNPELTTIQLGIIEKNISTASFVIWHAQTRYDITKIHKIESNLQEQFAEYEKLFSMAQDNAKKSSNQVDELIEKNKKLLEMLDESNKSRQAVDENLKKSIANCKELNNLLNQNKKIIEEEQANIERLTADKTELSKNFESYEKEHAHCKRIMKEYNFLKSLFAAALLYALWHHSYYADKIMSSFVTSTQ